VQQLGEGSAMVWPPKSFDDPHFVQELLLMLYSQANRLDPELDAEVLSKVLTQVLSALRRRVPAAFTERSFWVYVRRSLERAVWKWQQRHSKYRAITDLKGPLEAGEFEASVEDGTQVGSHLSTGASMALEQLAPQVLSLVVRLDREQIEKARANGKEPSPRDRRFDMLRLRHYEGSDWKSIASQYGVPTGTAWHLVCAAVAEIRHTAFGEGIDPDQVRVIVVGTDSDDSP
jgi:hypothetical protein